MTKTATAGLPGGVCIKVKFLGPTNHRGARYKATYRRSDDEVFTATVGRCYLGNDALGMDQAVSRAAQECLDKINKDREEILPGDPWEFVACGWDHDHYYFLASHPEL